MDKVDRLLGSMSAKVEDAFTAKSRIEEEFQLWNKKHIAMKEAEEQVFTHISLRFFSIFSISSQKKLN
jgi:hypothetical protein